MTGKRSQKGHGTIAAVELKKKKKEKKKKKKRFRIVSQPFIATYWMSLVNEEWYLCRFACKGTYLTTYALCSVSLLTMAAICVDRPLALLSGLRYSEGRYICEA